MANKIIRDEDNSLAMKRSRLSLLLLGRWWWLDMLSLMLTMLLVVFAPAIGEHLYPLGKVLALRISLLNFLLAAVCVLFWRFIQICTPLQSDHSRMSLAAAVWHIMGQITGSTVIAGLILWCSHPGTSIAERILAFWLISTGLFCCTRLLLFTLQVFVRPRFRRKRQAVIVGSGSRARQMAQQLQNHPRWNYRLLGFVDSEPQSEGIEILGGVGELESILMQRPIDEVIITLPVKSKYDDIQATIAICERAGVQSNYSVDLYAMEVTKRRTLDEQDASSVILHMVHNDRRRVLKRASDLAGATVGLLLLSPVFVCTALLIKITAPGPIIFRQQRYGLNRRRFTMYKFRSMVVDAEKQQSQLEHLNESNGPIFKIRRDPRITPVGRVIRQTSIDELPQLFNVLRGDMSLVGPRPLPMRDVGNFSEARLMRRFSVKPGLTGLWQVSGRSNSTFANWIKLDLEYIDGWTLLLDLKILAKTLPAVLRRTGAV